MTDDKKKQIDTYRKNGYGYKQISKFTGISLNTIKSYCRRNNLVSTDLNKNSEQLLLCEYCGKSIEQKPHKKRKRFCSDKCRNKWWNSHLDLVNRKANYEIICPNCKKAFTVYGNAKRKFCCHECYVNYRYGGTNNE